MKITVADGRQLLARGNCRNVAWSVQGVRFNADFMVFPLKGCDVVLGIR